MSPEEFSKRTCEELGVGSAFVQPIAQSISQQLIEYERKYPGWALEGTIGPAAENIVTVDVDVSSHQLAAPTLSATNEDIEGPLISSVQPVDQYEFNTRNWKHNRPASSKPN
eukprot:g3706.t1